MNITNSKVKSILARVLSAIYKECYNFILDLAIIPALLFCLFDALCAEQEKDK
jgi:hypothetical protein